ncbi:MAG: SPOR domain-containing protein [bacterium]|nr:SPOR domain-containing protein [bacterium]
MFRDLASQFPGSEHALLARSKADWPHDYFVIQCGAFKKIAGAHQHVKTLAQQRITALAVPEGVGSSRLYVVRVGRYPDYAAARQHLPVVRRVQPDAFIAP